MLQKIEILLLLGIAVLFCAVGCEEDASVQAGKTRPVNNQPGKAAPLPVDPATQSAVASKPKKASPASQTPEEPVAIRKAAPPKNAPEKSSKVSSPKQTAQNVELTHEQIQLYDSLRQQSLKLQMKLDDVQDRNEKLTRALVDSRDAGHTLQDNLQRTTIVQEIQKRELRELKDRLGNVAAKSADAEKDASTTVPVETGAPTQNDPVNLMLQIGRLRRKTEKLRLQLQLAQLDTPDARQKVLVKLGEATEQNENLEKLNRKLSHMVVTQADQIQELQQREEGLNHLQAEHAEQIARVDRRTRKELATMEIKIAEDRKKIGALKNQMAQREYQIRMLTEQLASRKTAPPAPAAAAPEPENKPVAVAARPVLIKVAPVEPVAAANSSPNPAPKPAKRPSPKPTLLAASPKAPVQAVASPPTVRAPVNQPVGGKITAMKGLMVMVDVGKNFGAEEGMRLIAYREDKFVGYLRVEQVGRRESACSFTRQVLPPQLGDHVVDRLE